MTREAPCPVCGKPLVAAYRPFCSGRCADIDLGRWLKGAYAIPAEEHVPEPVTDDPDTPQKNDET